MKKKTPAVKFIPYMWYTDNNNNFLPPVNFSNLLKSYLDNISLGVERSSAATVFNQYGFIQHLPADNTVPSPRIDYTPTNGRVPNSPDYLFEDGITNWLFDDGGAGNGYIKSRNAVSTTLLFQGLHDPFGRQFAVKIAWKGNTQTNPLTDMPFLQNVSSSFKPDSGFSLSTYIKQNDSAVYASGSSSDLERLIPPRYYAMRLESSDGEFYGFVWDWNEEKIYEWKSDKADNKVDLRAEKAYNGWFRVGIQTRAKTEIGQSWSKVFYGYVEPDTNFTGGWRFGPNTQYSQSGLWFGLQLETGSLKSEMTSLVWNGYANAPQTRTRETVNARGHSGVEQIFEPMTNSCIMFLRVKYPFNQATANGNASVGVSLYNAASGTSANFMGFSFGTNRELRGIIKRNNSTEFIKGKTFTAEDYFTTNKYGAKEYKYISLALVYNRTYSEFYVNGEKIGTTDTLSEAPDWQSNNAQLGVVFRNEFQGNIFFGRVNEFSIYHTSDIEFAEQSEFAKKLTQNNNPLKP